MLESVSVRSRDVGKLYRQSGVTSFYITMKITFDAILEEIKKTSEINAKGWQLLQPLLLVLSGARICGYLII